MKNTKRYLGVFLALLMMVSVPVTALAEEYTLDDGSITVSGTADGQTVTQEGGVVDEVQTTPTVITGSNPSGSIVLDTTGGDVSATISNVSTGTLNIIGDNEATVTVQGTNTFTGAWYAVDLYDNAADEACDADVSFVGSGTLEAIGSFSGVYIDDNNTVNVDGPTILAEGAWDTGIANYGGDLNVYSGSVVGASVLSDGIGIYDEGSLNVYGGSVAGTTQSDGDDFSGIYFGNNSTLTLGSGIHVLDNDGVDITEAAIADPTVLNNFDRSVIKPVNYGPTYTLYGAEGKRDVQLMGEYYGTSFEKVGEPDEEAMKLLSEGIDGECIYKARFLFNDGLEKHGTIKFVFYLPGYAGAHVTVSTIEDGAQVTYDRWVGNNETVGVTLNHLGDFAIFLAE